MTIGDYAFSGWEELKTFTINKESQLKCLPEDAFDSFIVIYVESHSRYKNIYGF